MMRSPVDENIPTLSLRRVCKDGGVYTDQEDIYGTVLTLLRGCFSRIARDRTRRNDLYSGAG